MFTRLSLDNGDKYLLSSPLEIKEQIKPDECAACAVSSIGESCLGRIVDPLFTYNKCKDKEFGLLLKSVCQSVIRDGLQLASDGTVVRPFTSFKPVFYIFSIFNGIKKALLDGKEVLADCYWQSEWDHIPGGVIDSSYQNLKLFPHAFKVFGFLKKNGIMYLVVQNSKGSKVGDNGLFYFPESIANKFLSAYYFN